MYVIPCMRVYYWLRFILVYVDARCLLSFFRCATWMPTRAWSTIAVLAWRSLIHAVDAIEKCVTVSYDNMLCGLLGC